MAMESHSHLSNYSDAAFGILLKSNLFPIVGSQKAGPESGGPDPRPGGGGDDLWHFENIILSLLVMLLLMFSLESFTVTPEVSFTFFQQHILSTGEVNSFLLYRLVYINPFLLL